MAGCFPRIGMRAIKPKKIVKGLHKLDKTL